MNAAKAVVQKVADEVLDGGDFVEQVLMSDALHEVIGALEAETHEEEMAITRREAGGRTPKYHLSSREWQTLDWFFAGVLQRHGAFNISDPKQRLRAYRALGKQALVNLQSVIDIRTDTCEMAIDDLAEAAAEPDVKKAFVLYIEAAIQLLDLDSNKDFQKRVMPALIEQSFDQQEWAQNYYGIPVPADYDYGMALTMFRNAEAAQ